MGKVDRLVSVFQLVISTKSLTSSTHDPLCTCHNPEALVKEMIDFCYFLTKANQWSQPGGTCSTPPAFLLPY